MEPENNERIPWTEQETFALLRLWEDHLVYLRRTKRNAKVYGEIVEKLRAMGFSRSAKEVKKKMQNLGNKYRLVQAVAVQIRAKTGSSREGSEAGEAAGLTVEPLGTAA
ncbi:unnamed protein product [Ixodes persulcatus]